MMRSFCARAIRTLWVVLALAPCAAFGQKNVIHSDWRVDTGALRPSHGMMRYYDRETKLAYAFHNDGNALLITIRGADQAMARRMVAMGMVVSIDTLGRKKRGATIDFPLGMHAERTGGDGSYHAWSGQGEHRLPMDAVNMRLSTQGFKGEADGEHMAGGEDGIQAHIDMDPMDVATYDVRVPFSSILGREITAADTLKAWSIQITVNAFTGGGHAHGDGGGSGSGMDAAGVGQEGGGTGAGPAYGGGGFDGGGHDGGQGGGGDASAELPASFQVKFILAFRP